MKKLICLMLMLSLIVLNGCSVFGSKNDYLLEDITVAIVDDINATHGLIDSVLNVGETYNFFSYDNQKYLGNFKVANRHYIDSYAPYVYYRYDIWVNKSVYEKYKRDPSAGRFTEFLVVI